MNTFSEPHKQYQVIGTKLASELSPGDSVYFAGTGLVKHVHSVDQKPSGFEVNYCQETDRALVYPKAGVLVRWDPPHNKVNWYTAPNTKVDLV